MEIPEIDISSFVCQENCAEIVQKQKTILQAWDQAFSRFGFCYLVGHGVDRKLISRLESVAAMFFALPFAEKESSNLGKGYGHGGYVPVGRESNF
jgi:isopenicillin N synthase-like dioxygenase